MPPAFIARRLSVDDRVRLLRLTIRVRRLRSRYLRGIKRLRDATWRAKGR